MITSRLSIFLFVLLLVTGLLLEGCQTQPQPVDELPPTPPPARTAMPDNGDAKNIMETAVAADQFKTLVKAIRAVKLGPTLRGEGPFTVFAPNNAAFEKLPEGTLMELLKPENAEKLKGILTYHVVAGKFMAADVAGMTSAKTVNGNDLAIKVEGDFVMVNSAKVTKTDIQCSNGVIHVIDSVLLPE